MTSPLTLVPPSEEERDRLVNLAVVSPNMMSVEKVLGIGNASGKDITSYQALAIDAVDHFMQLQDDIFTSTGPHNIPGTLWSVNHSPTRTIAGSSNDNNFEQACGISHRDLITLTHQDGRNIPLKVFFRHDNSVALILKVEYPSGKYVPLTIEDTDILTAFRNDIHTSIQKRKAA